MQIQLTLNTWSGGISLLVNKLSIENRAFCQEMVIEAFNNGK